MKQDIHIVKILEGKDKNQNKEKLCIFSHFDRFNDVSDYVVHYLKDLSINCNFEIIFVTNSSDISEENLKLIESYVSKIIIRNNIGYDFASYFSGFSSIVQRDKYKKILFANDSVYGPFYSLRNVFEEMDSKYKAWGMMDEIFPQYHIQSYFMQFDQSIFILLEEFFNNFEYISDKEQLIIDYEIGLSKFLIPKNIFLTAYCEHEKMIAKEFKDDKIDEDILKLKDSFSKTFFYGYNIKSLFSKKYLRNLEFKKLKALYYGANHKMWLTSIRYFKNPFIKISLVCNPKLLAYHMFLYLDEITKNNPDFDINLIKKDSRRKRIF